MTAVLVTGATSDISSSKVARLAMVAATVEASRSWRQWRPDGSYANRVTERSCRKIALRWDLFIFQGPQNRLSAESSMWYDCQSFTQKNNSFGRNNYAKEGKRIRRMPREPLEAGGAGPAGRTDIDLASFASLVVRGHSSDEPRDGGSSPY